MGTENETLLKTPKNHNESIENKERRSLAFNYTFKVFDTETGAQILGDSVNATNGTVAGDLSDYGQISNFQKKLYEKN